MTADQETHPQAYAGSKFEASADDLLDVISIDVVAERTPGRPAGKGQCELQAG